MDNSSIYRIILTGGPGSGKTTLLNELKARGFSCFDEVSRKVISNQQASGGTKLPWVNLDEFAWENYYQMLLDFRNAIPGLNFYDRSVADIPAYYNLYRKELPRELLSGIKELHYSTKVFFLPPWQQIYINDPERPESYEDSVYVSIHLKNTYRKLNYSLIEVPKTTISERADFILDHLGKNEKLNIIINELKDYVPN